MSTENTCDTALTVELHELFQVPREERKEDWLEDFFEIVPHASLRGFEPQIQRGPDGFPYVILSLPEENEEYDEFSVADAIPFCLQNGVGIALFADPKKLEQPEWVFPFGSLWSFKAFGNFVGDPSDEIPEGDERPSEEELKTPREVQVSAPSEEFLPPFARKAISRFLKETIGLEKPRVALIIDPILKPSRALMFADLQPERFEQPDHFVQLMNALRWFLPATRGLMPGIPQIEPHAVPIA